MNYEEATEFLDRHIGLGIRPGLERINAMLELMARPDRTYPIVHITGSNGKTSTARLTTAILAAHGLSTGTFISPHLERIEERLALNGVDATREEFAAAVADVVPFADLVEAQLGDRPTYFELTAAIAFAWFADKAVDVGVVEVGLGGRLDATNAADGIVAVVTSVAREHTAFLGETLPEIAREKLAIAKEGSVLVVGVLPSEALEEADEHAARQGIRQVRVGRDFRVESATMAVGGWQIDLDGIYGHYDELYLPVHGRHQTTNLAVATAAAEELLGRELSVDAVREALAGVEIPGRMEVIRRRPLVLLDGAHNDEGFGVLARALAEEFPARMWTLVIGVMTDKKLTLMLEEFVGQVGLVVATASDSSRAMPTESVAEIARQTLGPEVEVIEASTVAEAVAVALGRSEAEDALLIAGSLYVVGEARTALAGS